MEDQKKPLPYPKSVFFIVSNEFCERFSYYGMKTVLSLYLVGTLHYSENQATVLYHVFGMLCYFFPLFGAMIADSFLGKFNTILYLSIVYAFGSIVLSFASTAFATIPYTSLSLLGLLLIAIGTGGIKPCVSSFGGDQFVLPDQALQLQRFFSIFYFSINAGSLISTFFTPILRNVKCLDQQTCFPLAFGTPAVLMIASVVIFVCGKRLYSIKKPKENVITIFFSCIAHALKNKMLNGSQIEKKKYWLEYADDRFSHQQINDIKAVLKVLYLFIPVPFFWALFDQQGSRWTFQATNMDGRLFGYYIKPDQMQVMNPLLILIFIPIFELYVYPLLKRIRIKRPLQKLTLGGFMAAASFVLSAYVEHYVEQSHAIIPSVGEGRVHLFNSLNCTVHLNPAIRNIDQIGPLSAAEFLHFPVNQSELISSSITADQPCSSKAAEIQFLVYEKKSKSYFIYKKSDQEVDLLAAKDFDNLSKDKDGVAKLRAFYDSVNSSPITLTFSRDDYQNSITLEPRTYSENIDLDSDVYNVLVNGTVILANVPINPAEIDVLLLQQNQDKVIGNIVNVVPPNKVHMLWQLPQIIILTAAEIMFSITGLEFSFTQAPESMKSILSSAWLLTVAFGNLIVVIISEIEIFHSQVYEFLLFAGLMALDMLLFVAFSVKYQYTDYSNKKDDDRNEQNDQIGASLPTLSSELST